MCSGIVSESVWELLWAFVVETEEKRDACRFYLLNLTFLDGLEILQEAARQATPSPLTPLKARGNNITFDIKNLVLKKRNVRKPQPTGQNIIQPTIN